jgi:hypothetical protein
VKQARDLENTFARAFELMVRNWTIILVPIACGILGGMLEFAFSVVVLGSYTISGNGSPDALYAIHDLADIAVLVVSAFVSVVEMAFVTGMAGSAWLHGRATLADGSRALARRLGATIGASLILFAIAICAATLAPVTFYVTVVVFVVLCIYTMASVIIGEHGATDAIAESCRLALANVAPTIGVVALVVLIALAGALAGFLIGGLSELAGWLVAGVLQQIIVAYASLVIAGEYVKLSGGQTGSKTST